MGEVGLALQRSGNTAELEDALARFDHERLDVYHLSIRMVAALYQVTERVRRGHADLVNQARRAATSVPLNIAEAAAEFAPDEKRRIFRIARRSALECAAALDVLESIGALAKEDLTAIRDYLSRIAAMLTVLVKEKPVA